MINQTDLDSFGYYDQDYQDDIERCKTPMDMVKEYANVTGQTPSSILYASLIAEEYNEWNNEACFFRDYHKPEELGYEETEELKELADLAYVIFGYANARGWDLMEALRRVHLNNIYRCYQPDGTIKRREDGKIVKNPNYPKVDLSDLV